MKAEIIAVGSELLTPDNIDTNSLYLTHRLNEAGFMVHLKTIVGDDLDDIAGILRGALRRSDVVILCGFCHLLVLNRLRSMVETKNRS